MTLQQYQTAVAETAQVEKSWWLTLGVIAIGAVINMVSTGLLLLFSASLQGDDGDDDIIRQIIWADILVLGFMGKHIHFLFILLHFSRSINDVADEFCLVLFRSLLQSHRTGLLQNIEAIEEKEGTEPTGEPGLGEMQRKQVKLEEENRQLLLSLETLMLVFSGSTYSFLQEEAQIAWKILGVRWTTRYFLTLVVSYSISLCAFIIGQISGID